MPATPLISIVDNQDGTGALATISGSTAGSTNSVNVYQFTQNLGRLSTPTTYSRVGDGTLALPVANGAWWAEIVSELAGAYAIGLPYYFWASDFEESVWWRLLLKAQSVIQGLNIPEFSPAEVLISKLPINLLSPEGRGIFLHPTPETIEFKWNTSDVYGYGILVAIAEKSNGKDLEGLDDDLRWRETVQDAFKLTPSYNPFSGIPEFNNLTKIEPGSVVLPEAWLNQYDAGSFVLRVFCNISRY